MTYTLTKGKVKVQIRIMAESAEMIRSVEGNLETSKTVMTPKEGNQQVNDLLRQGFTAHKRKS
jgi:hypothetical protein